MADSTSRTYSPRNWRRICDTCGMQRDFADLTFHPLDGIYSCTYDAGERTKVELDKGNARPPHAAKIIPVPYPKPQNLYYPNTLETDDAAVFNFLARMVEARCRYEGIASGASPLTSVGAGVGALSWTARYFYDLIQEDDRRLLIEPAEAHLTTIATYLLARQYGSPTGPDPSATLATSALFGAITDPDIAFVYTNDVAAAGLALLYAYRVHGNGAYLDGARAAASYLRNVQAIGSNGTNFTSQDLNGTIRLYTGSLAATVSTDTGFYSDHSFYASALIALEFWNELKTTDGDQDIGTTGTPTGFDSACSQLMSVCMSQLRDCWSVGIAESGGSLINGLSTTTPREFFNAYPQDRPEFSSSAEGTGTWEFVNGNADNGTQVSSQTFARALSALYNYEGATSQVTTISDWLRSFTSNPDFETPDDTPTSELYQGTTGEYDPTATIATLLTVRDADDSYAATAINGSSVYDWGAFGLLSRIWSSRNRSSFMASRLFPLNVVQRFYNGNATDIEQDRITTKGTSGLSMQTGFTVVMSTNGSATADTTTLPNPGSAMVNDAVMAAQFGRSFRETRG